MGNNNAAEQLALGCRIYHLTLYWIQGSIDHPETSKQNIKELHNINGKVDKWAST